MIGAIGALIFNVLPVLVGSAADGRELSSQEVGFIGTSYFLGYTLISIAAILWVQRINWPLQGFAAAVIAICGLAYVVATESYMALLAGFFITGCGAGAIYALSFYIVGCSREPDRIFGIKVFVEIGTPALTMWLLTNFVIANWGFNGVLLTIMMLFLFLALGNFIFPKRTVSHVSDTTDSCLQPAADDTGPGWMVWLSLFGLLLWMCGTTGTWVFLERMGNDLGFVTEAIGTVLSAALIISALGALSAAVVADRLGRKLPLVAANMIALAALCLLLAGGEFWVYALALSLFSFGWVAAFPYLLAIVASVDFKGNRVVLASAALSLGAAVGPGAAGMLKSGASYSPILFFGMGSIIIGLLLFLYILARLQRLTGDNRKSYEHQINTTG